MRTGDPANALCWKPIWTTSQSFIQTACCAPRGPPSGMRARRRDANQFGRCVDCLHGAGPLGAVGDEQSQGLPPLGQRSDCIRSSRLTCPIRMGDRVVRCHPNLARLFPISIFDILFHPWNSLRVACPPFIEPFVFSTSWRIPEED
jgi:hypothetical protein